LTGTDAFGLAGSTSIRGSLAAIFEKIASNASGSIDKPDGFIKALNKFKSVSESVSIV
jgi:hypothetical protein